MGPGVASEEHEPREGVRRPSRWVEELLVAAEDLVGRLPGQGHRGVPPDRLEQQVQRRVHVAEAGRDVEAQVLARAVTWHAEHRVLLNGDGAVVFH